MMASGLCYNITMGRVYSNTCKYCSKPYRGLGRLYCSSSCKNKDRANDPNFIKKLSESQKKRWTPEQRAWRSKLNKERGIRPPSPFTKGHKLGFVGKGNKNPNWKGGITPIHLAIRSSKEYKEWRKAVYERDNYTCIFCGVIGNGKNLNADHILPFAIYEDLRLEVSNGRTLCIDCHKQTPTYGRPKK